MKESAYLIQSCDGWDNKYLKRKQSQSIISTDDWGGWTENPFEAFTFPTLKSAQEAFVHFRNIGGCSIVSAKLEISPIEKLETTPP